MSTKVDRRSFIKTSAAVGTAALAGRSALGESAPTVATGTVRRGANDEIRMAILGIRTQGQNHIGYQSSGKNIRIVTLCDVDENLFADRVKLVPGGKPEDEADCAAFSTTKTSTASSSPCPTTGTLWQRSGRVRRARTCTSKSRPPTAFPRARR